ncbi:hypothetical protein C3K47_15780 [Solitalea longa]|uniref:Integron Cassette Protein Hfx-Cass5 domain-containing protein n=1 Tax=Solitalea longa TaxID=2079460 RepID=A0A2S4ZZF9_9SPHI|nr:hypothetical protein [Solitalea longa]POY35243.1 hypothetical protein C3K47_15780 [Solitalea longa]
MTKDKILEIGIDDKERLFIKPEKERFTLIYRTATEVHWDNNGLFLYSPKPQGWSYFDWFRHITGVTETECNYKLLLTNKTLWTNISDELKQQIIEYQKQTYNSSLSKKCWMWLNKLFSN